MFTGESGGCGDFFVYRLNPTKSLAIAVRLDEQLLQLTEGPQTFQIDKHPKAIRIQVMQFPKRLQSGDEYFCTDWGPNFAPICTWRAISGKLVVTKDTSAPHFGNATHRISVLLTDVVVQQDQDPTIEVALEPVEIANVEVGWVPG